MDTDGLRYLMKPEDAYARLTAYFPEGEVIYTNVFARYDVSVSDSPYREPSHTVDVPMTILFNILLLIISAGIIALFYRLIIRR